MNIKAVVRTIGKMLKWSVIVFVALVVALVAINAVDEELKPQAAAALQWVAPDVPVAENGFFMIVGVGAEAGQDPHAAGVRWVEQITRAKTLEEIEQADGVLKRQQLRFAGDAKLLCTYYSGKSCLDLIAANQSLVRGMQEANQEWLARYERVQGYQRFATAYAYPSGHTMPHLWQYGRAQRLFLAGIALQMLEGRSREALGRLVRDVGTQRRVLLGCTDLYTKLFAANQLGNDYRLASEAMRLGGAPAPELGAAYDALLAPLAAPELAMEKVILTEYRVFSGFFTDTRPEKWSQGSDVPAWLNELGTALFFKRNATLNRAWDHFKATADLDRLPSSQIRATGKAVLTGFTEDPWWSWLYNPVGKLLLLIGEPESMPAHILRVRDVEGLRRLISLQRMVLEQRVADADIESFIDKAGPALRDPHADRPMSWDAAKRQLYFKTVSGSGYADKDGRLFVQL